MPDTGGEGAKEDDSDTKFHCLMWKIYQRDGIKVVRVESMHTHTSSVVPIRHLSEQGPQQLPCQSWQAGSADARAFSVLDRPAFKSQFCYFTYELYYVGKPKLSFSLLLYQ